MSNTPDTVPFPERVLGPQEHSPEEILEKGIIDSLRKNPDALQPLYPGSPHMVAAFETPDGNSLILVSMRHGQVEDGYFMVRPIGSKHRETSVFNDLFSYETHWATEDDQEAMVSVARDLETATPAEPSARLQQEMIRWAMERRDNFKQTRRDNPQAC